MKKWRKIGSGLSKKEVALIKKSNPKRKFRSRKKGRYYFLYAQVKKSKKGNWIYA